jgi:hypothetical protein
MSFTTPIPPQQIVQSGPENCWAAALESWLKAVKAGLKLTQAELVRKFTGTGIHVHKFEEHSTDWEMDYKIVKNFPSASEMESTVKTLRYLFVSFKVQGFDVKHPWWHCDVLYGVNIPADDEPTYVVMDPDGGKLTSYPKSEFFQIPGAGVFIGWHKKPTRAHHKLPRN